MSLITAFVRGLPYEQNAGRNMALAKDVRDAKFGYTPLYGYWTYDESDPGTGEKTGRKEKIKEDTLLVSVPDRMPNDDFRSTVLAWVKRYQQEAAVAKYADADVGYLLAANGTESRLGRWSINRLAEIYSQMRWEPMPPTASSCSRRQTTTPGQPSLRFR